MAEFATEPYYTPMDRQYGEEKEVKPHANIEEPIFPINRVGQTVAETGKYPNLVQDLNAAIRGGQGTIELQTMPQRSFEEVGKEAREAIRDLAHANEVKITSVHCPNEVQNLSGFNPQRGTITKEFANSQLEEVKNAIRFAADVLHGGAVVVHPQYGEFQRNMARSDWNKTGKWAGAFEEHPGEREEAMISFVEPDTGKIQAVPLSDGQWVHMDKETGEKTDYKNPQKWFLEDFERHAKRTGDKPLDVIKKEFLSNQIMKSQSDIARLKQSIRITDSNLEALESRRERMDKDEYEKTKDDLKEERKWEERGIIAQHRDMKETQDKIKNWTPLDEFAIEKSAEGYANAAIIAMDESQNMPKTQTGELFIAIENSWPAGYGTHPEELIELISVSRKKMAEMLHDRGFSPNEAVQEAQKRIKATFDTAHMGMWLKHFKKKSGETEDQKLARFKEWYLDETKSMAEKGIIGNVHLVDTQGTRHQHLPIGQGVMPIKEAMQVLKKEGYSGYLISEAFEEEKYGAGRMSIETWKELGADVPSAYMTGPRRSLAEIHRRYVGRTPSPRQMFGSYVPPHGEYKPWSEIPFE